MLDSHKILLVILLLLGPLLTNASDRLHITLGNNYGKHAMVVEGNPAGIQKDLLTWFLIDHMNLDVKIDAMPWKRAQVLVEKKMADGYFTAYTKRRVEELKLVPTKKAFYKTQVKMHTWVGNPKIPYLERLTSKDDLLKIEGLRHIFIRGHGYHEEQFGQAKLVNRVDSAAQVARYLLEYKRADIFVEQSELFYPAIEEAGLKDTVLSLSNVHFKDLKWHLYIRPDSEHIKLMGKIDRALEEAINNGVLVEKVKQIFGSYGLRYNP